MDCFATLAMTEADVRLKINIQPDKRLSQDFKRSVS